MAGSVYEGKTYDEAVKKGLEALRLTRAEAVITTVEEGKGGFLGFGARPYRVSVARRPGGAIREPSERAGGEERRGGRRGGREERPAARGGRRGTGERGREAHGAPRAGGEERGAGTRGRGGRDRSAAPGSAPGRRTRDEAGERPRAGGQGRGGRAEASGPAAERAPRASSDRPAPPRREERAREDRGREDRGREERGREERGREERGGEDRGREARPARDAHAPQPPQLDAELRPTAPITGAAGPGAEGDDGTRKRRRRGRRGGRGRRRGPGGAFEGAATSEGPALNGDDTSVFDDAAAPEHEAPAYEARPEPEPASAPSFPPAMASSLPEVHAPTRDPAPTWEPAPMPPASETEAEPAYAARDTMSRPERGRRMDRGERHRARPETAPDMNADELSSTSQRLTEELLKAMGFEPRVSVHTEGNRVDVTVEVDRDDDLLNGRLGETRQALQHLLNRFLNKGDGSRYHLQLEVNDHWQHRETELAELAHRLAEEAATRQVEVVSDFLNSQERRIVHMTLREDGRVKTYSLGSGGVKRVAVAPASFPDRSEDDPAS